MMIENKASFTIGSKIPPDARVPKAQLVIRGEPTRSSFRRTTEARKEYSREEISKLFEAGKIEKSTSPFRSALNVVETIKGGKVKFRITIDYRLVNKMISEPANPMAFQDVEIGKLHGCSKIAVFDFAYGYNQIPLDRSSRDVTAFADADGNLWQWTVLPLGLAPSGAIFMQTVAAALQEHLEGKMWYSMARYVDDIAFGANNWSEFIKRTRAFLTAIRKTGFHLKMDKVQIAKERTILLGREISNGRVSAADESIEAIRRIPAPRNREEARSAAAAANWLRPFILDLHKLIKPIYKAARVRVFLPNTYGTAPDFALFGKFCSKLDKSGTIRKPSLR
jgi:hypothetical protein